MAIQFIQKYPPRAAFTLLVCACALCSFSVAASGREAPRDQLTMGAVRTAANAPQSSVRPADLSVLPQRSQVFQDPQSGGVAAYGMLNGPAHSAQSVLLSVLEAQESQTNRRFRFFDGIPRLQAVVADRSDHNVQALFSATRQGTPIMGVVSISLDNGGSVSLLFDRPNSFSNSFLRLRQAMAQSAPRGHAEVPLHSVRLADGSSISLPQGWNVTNVNKGSVDLSGPRGEEMSLGAAASVYNHVRRLPYMPANYVFQAPCCDPVRAYAALFPQIAGALAQRSIRPPQVLDGILEYQATAWPRGQAAYILSASRMAGRPRLNYLLVAAMPSYMDPWTVYMSGVSAPTDVFREELPTMLRIWGSYSVNPAIFTERLQHAAQTMKSTAEMMRATAAETSRAMQSCHEGWDQVIRGVQTIEDPRTGERMPDIDNTMSQRLADQLSTDTGHQWVIVPPSRLIPR